MDIQKVPVEVFIENLNLEMRNHDFYNPGWSVSVKPLGGAFILVSENGANPRLVNECFRSLWQKMQTEVTIGQLQG